MFIDPSLAHSPCLYLVLALSQKQEPNDAGRRGLAHPSLHASPRRLPERKGRYLPRFKLLLLLTPLYNQGDDPQTQTAQPVSFPATYMCALLREMFAMVGV